MSPSGLDDLDAWRLRFCLLLKLHFPSLKIGDMTSTLPWDFLGCLKPPVEMVAKSPSSWIVSYWLAYLLSIYCLENTWKTLVSYIVRSNHSLGKYLIYVFHNIMGKHL